MRRRFAQRETTIVAIAAQCQSAWLRHDPREEAVLRTLTDDVLKSSEIEGEKLDADQVRSSVAPRLGMDIGGLKQADRHVEGVVEMMLDSTRYDQLLTEERLLAWPASLFPAGRSGMHPIKAGAWRDDSTAPMQVVSGPVGHERVHFEAPAAERLDEEVRQFLESFNGDVTTEPAAYSESHFSCPNRSGRQDVAQVRGLLLSRGTMSSRGRRVHHDVSLTPELEKFVEGKVESGLYNNASEVIREGLRLLKEHDEIRLKWREQIERGWLQAQTGRVVDGDEVFRKADERIKQRGRKRA